MSSFSAQISGWPGHNVVPLVVRLFSFFPFASWLRLWGFSSFCAEPTHFWVPVGHRWSAGAGSQSDPRCSGSLPQAGECSWAAAGPRGLCHKCWEHLTTQQSPGAVCPAGVQGKEALEKWKPKELVASGSPIPTLTKLHFLGWGRVLISPRVWPAGSIVENNLKLKPSLLSKALPQGHFLIYQFTLSAEILPMDLAVSVCCLCIHFFSGHQGCLFWIVSPWKVRVMFF